MRATTLLLMSAIAALLLACSEEKTTITDVIDDAPEACRDWCRDTTTCGWDTSDWLPVELEEAYSDDRLDFTVDRCVADCLLYLEEGVPVYETVIDQCFEYGDDGECTNAMYDNVALDPIPGDRLKRYLSCILGFHTCEGEELEPDDQQWTTVSADDQASCEEKTACYDELGLEGYISFEWLPSGDTGVCSYVEPEREYHFLGPSWL